MLEIRNVTKIYQSKSGNSVKALDNVSVTFPETGMVFVLGKSGSGKSTLLNVIGGLDGYDGGEFIIKGKSSKDFAGSDFDAYRNTFIGFIFQEYNVLDDFTVGANIGLALELQGKKATNQQITDILKQVDMLEYAKRKPNELSGGQKQRVAIARALVKDPEIIMADEPTGALDSNTGKQIFDTLKELSRTKLVIIVSHDRDFAEKYGDRIIEMKDGQIASDVTKHEVAAKSISSGILQMGERLLRIEKGYQLTSRDVELINEYLRAQDADIIVSGDKRLNDGVRTAAGISQNNSSSVFNDTDAEKDVNVKQYKGSETKFIRSRLPFKNAIKIGKSGLGHKKFRLVSTIALSLVAFTLFGFADTLSSYNKYTSATESIIDSNIQNATFSLELKHTWEYADGTSSYFQGTGLNEQDIKTLSEKTGIDFIPVFTGVENVEWGGGNISLAEYMISTSDISSESAYTGNLYGFTAVGGEKLESLGFPIVGKMPVADDEIAISEFIYRQLNHTGFKNSRYDENVKAGELTMNESGAKSIIGKHLSFSVNGETYDFEITAVISTGFDYDRYDKYVPKADDNQSNMEEGNAIVDMVMMAELANSLKYGFHGLGYVTQSNIDKMAENMRRWGSSNSYIGIQLNSWSMNLISEAAEQMGGIAVGGDMFVSMGNSYYINRIAQSSNISSVGNIKWLDGRTGNTLAPNEILVSDRLTYSDYREYSVDMTKILADYDSQKSIVPYEMSVYEFVVWAENMKALDKITTLTESQREQLKQYYGKFDGNNAPSDAELITYWKENFATQRYTELPMALTEEDVKPAFVSILKKAFNKEFSKELNTNFYINALDRLHSLYEVINLNDYDIRRVLAYEYAYTLYKSDNDFYKGEDFYNVMMSSRFPKYEDWVAQDDLYTAIEIYVSYLTTDRSEEIGGKNEFGGEWGEKSYSDFDEDVDKISAYLSGADEAENPLKSLTVEVRTWDRNGNENTKKYTEYKVVGTFDGGSRETIICDGLYDAYIAYCKDNGYGIERVAEHDPGEYSFVIAPMPSDRATIEKLVDITYDESGDVRFVLQNQVMDTLYSFNDFIEVGAKVCLYVGIGFAVFAALMLMNFISSSIAHKRREIGILRAVGARSSDVFKIFFSEAAIIALINYVLSLAATIAATTIVNTVIRNQGINVTLLSFGIRQIAIMLLISAAVAFIASFLPVWNIARRKPVDAIKNK